MLPLTLNQGLWTFDVKLTDIRINRWTRPSQIKTTVNFRTVAQLQAVKDQLLAGETHGLSVTISSPLRIDLTDNWAHFNKQTGCYE